MMGNGKIKLLKNKAHLACLGLIFLPHRDIEDSGDSYRPQKNDELLQTSASVPPGQA